MENVSRGSGVHRRVRVDADRVFYCGDLGQPAMRRSGAFNLYVSLVAPIRYRLEGQPWREAECLVMPPHTAHQIVCDSRMACDLMLEPESVDLAQLPDFLRGPGGAVDAAPFVQRMRAAAHGATLAGASMDLIFFGHLLPGRVLDPRIKDAVRRLQLTPNTPVDAEDFAAQAGLSSSRFLHLFKQETGCSYRAYRAWKRARMLLSVINRPQNLAALAQDIGYPDSTHFSHSIRRYFGISPKDILRGCRRLQIVH